MADFSGRKMVLLGKYFSLFSFVIFTKLITGSMWTACVLSVFQLLSDDYISYVFFIFFLGIAIGAVHVITVPYVMEMVKYLLLLFYFCFENCFLFSFQLNLVLYMVYYY